MSSTSHNTPATDTPRIFLLMCAFALFIIGLVMVYSASVGQAVADGTVDSSSYLIKQARFAGLGIVIALFIWGFGTPSRLRWRVITVLLIAITWALLLATTFNGVTVNGAKRWISIGGATLQPSEFIKIFLVIVACKLFADYQDGQLSFAGFVGLMLGLIMTPLAFLFVTQSDLGSACIICVGVFAVLVVGGAPPKWIVFLVVLALLLVIASIAATPYRLERLYNYNPWSDGENGSGNGFQLVRSFYAFSQGGLFGAGIGNSTEKLTPLPEAETDFIFAIIGEEMGFVGAVLVIVLFFGFLIAGLKIAKVAEDPFAAMLAGGLSVMLVFQAFLNIACVIGVVPTTGKPLPFISSGGSSMISSILIVGLIMIAKPAGGGGTIYDRRRDNLKVVRTEKVVRPRSGR